MAVINAQIRWASNTEELKNNLREGIGVIDAMKQSVDRTAASMGGQGLFLQANKVTAAITQLCGVTKLTAAEQERASAVLDKAIEKYKVMGMTAPPAMIELRDAMKGAGDEAGGLSGFIERLGHSMAAHVAEGVLLRDVVRDLLDIGKRAFEDAAKFEDLSKATGLSVASIQEFSYVGKEFGVDTEQMAKGVEQLSAKLANGDANATKAVQMLGLSVRDLLAAGPREAFLQIAEAVGRIEDPMQKNAIAAELFGGRLGKQLIPMLGDLREKMDEAAKSGAIMSDDTVKAAHDFQVGWDRSITWVEAKIATLVGSMVNYRAEAAKFASANPELQRLGLRGAGPFDPGRQYGASNAGAGTLPSASLGMYQGALVSVNNTAKEVISTSDLLANRLKAQEDEWANLTATDKRSIDVRLKLKESDQEIAAALSISATTVARYKEAHQQAAAADREWQKVLDDVNSSGQSWVDTLNRINPAVAAWSMQLLKAGVSLETVKKDQGLTEAQGKALENQIKFLSTTTELSSRAFGNHGQVLEALQPRYSQFHDELTGIDHETGLLHARMIDSGTATFGFADAAKYAAQQTEIMRERLAETHITLAQGLLQDLHQIPSMLANAFTGGGGVMGAVQGVGTMVGSTIGQSIGKGVSMLGKMGGPIGEAIGSLVGPLIGWIASIGGPSKDELAARDTFGEFQKQFGTLQQTIDGVGAAYVKAGKTGVEAQQALQRALDATHISAQAEKAALDEINGVLNAQKQDESDLNTAIQTYKFSIEELGPAMQKQKLDQQANQLMNDWRLLVQSGIQLTTVNEHMASSMQEYLSQAALTGQEVPMAMQPIIQKMIDQGLLTDSAGNKITDLKDLGVTFAESMTAGFNKIVDKLTELIDKINTTTGAINAIPNSKTITIDTVYTSSGAPSNGYLPGDQYDPNGNYASAGGLVTATGIQYFGAGGSVLPFLPRGTDTVPAMLTPGEMVLTRRQQRAVFGGGGAPTIDMSEFKAMREELSALRSDQRATAQRLPAQLAAAVTSAVLQARVGRR